MAVNEDKASAPDETPDRPVGNIFSRAKDAAAARSGTALRGLKDGGKSLLAAGGKAGLSGEASRRLVQQSGRGLRRWGKFLLSRLRSLGIRPGYRNSGHLFYKFGVVTVVLSLLTSFATYFILTNLTPIRPSNEVVALLLFLSIVCIIIMSLLVAWQIVDLWRARRREQAGARLHVRIVTLFSLIATVPAILLAIFASIHIDGSLDQLFSNRIQSIINQSVIVAKSYMAEHGQGLKNDVLAMKTELDSAARLARRNPRQFKKLLDFQASLRGVSQAYLIDAQGKVLASASNSLKKAYYPPVKEAFKVADKGGVVRLSLLKYNKVAALKKLDNFTDTYLYILRSISPTVIRHMQRAQANVRKYQQLKQARSGVQVALGLMYVTIALSLLLAAVWLGLWFANRLVAPIRTLIGAAQRVSQGDLDTSVNVRDRHGDLALLANTFNNMTAELKSQRDELVETNTTLDERRRFIEAVLYGVTAGVIGLDREGHITLANRSARALLGLQKGKTLGRDIAQVVPQFSELLEQARRHPRGRAEGEISMIVGKSERSFAVRVTQESSGDEVDGYVLTFDDITELVTAQRTSAWADVARRIAHEIKNPLTPIQLSAERLRRKYGRSIEEDRETFDKLTETIIRHVGDIKRMVDEFSSFARMPKPVMERHDLRQIIRDAVILFQVSHPEIKFDIKLPDAPAETLCDRRLITQAVTNLVKNASEAIAAMGERADKEANYQGRIFVRLLATEEGFSIDVIDNGIGLPRENRNRLVEPYMTTREKGTGLGLAIVKKITEQHHGELRLEDASSANCPDFMNQIKHGACVRLSMPLRDEGAAEGELEAAAG